MSVIGAIVAAPIASAIIGSAAVGVTGSVIAGNTQAKAIKGGAATEAATAEKNLAFQKEQADLQRQDFAPWRDAGENALNQIEAGIASGEFTMDSFDFTADPNYQFRLDQGIKARDNSASARGRVNSGAQMKAIEEYGQNVASNEYANAYARESSNRTKKYNILSNLNTGGQSSAARQAQTTGQLATNSGNIMANLGQTQNMAAVNAGSARAGTYRDVATGVNQAAQNWITYKTA